MRKLSNYLILFCAGLIVFLPACAPERKIVQPTLASSLIFYDWAEDVPQEVLDQFEAEYGVHVDYQTYEDQETAIENLRQGKSYDVVVVESRLIPLVRSEGLVSPLNYENILNFKNISLSFRDLQYDPGNKYSVPFNYGSTGLLVRTDKVDTSVTSWSDLWDPRYRNHVAVWRTQSREVFALALKSIGLSANSEVEQDMQAGMERLLQLRPYLLYLDDYDAEFAAAAFVSGDVYIAMGYAGDLSACREAGIPMEYVYPEEGALIWGDNFVIPTSSANPYTAETFINFLLRPEIAALIVNYNNYATPNELALDMVDKELLAERAIFPTNGDLTNAEIILPLSPSGQERFDQLWEEWLKQ